MYIYIHTEIREGPRATEDMHEDPEEAAQIKNRSVYIYICTQI